MVDLSSEVVALSRLHPAVAPFAKQLADAFDVAVIMRTVATACERLDGEDGAAWAIFLQKYNVAQAAATRH